MFRGLKPDLCYHMNKGGSNDFKYATIRAVNSNYPSTCDGPQGVKIPGGDAFGYIIEIPNHNFTIYHASNTGIFGDMKLIDELYKPDVALLPIGDFMGMGPREAAYAVKNLLPTPKKIISTHFNTFDEMTGTHEEFEAQCKELGVEGKEIIHPKTFYGGAAVLE